MGHSSTALEEPVPSQWVMHSAYCLNSRYDVNYHTSSRSIQFLEHPSSQAGASQEEFEILSFGSPLPKHCSRSSRCCSFMKLNLRAETWLTLSDQPLRKSRRTNCNATASPLPARACEIDLGANQTIGLRLRFAPCLAFPSCSVPASWAPRRA